MFNFNHFYYFYMTVKLDGVTAAAKMLNTSQSSLSTQLKTLEGSLGKKLFKKVGRRLELTTDGETVFGYCRRSFEIMDELGSFLRNNEGIGRTRISIGVSDEIDRPFATDQVARAVKATKEESRPLIRMVSASHQALANKLTVQESQVLLTTQQAYGPEVAVVGEFEMPVVFVGRPGFIYSKVPDLPIGKLVNSIKADLVLPTSDLRLRHEFDELAHRHNINKTIAFEGNVLVAVQQAVVDGLGVGFFPLPYVSRELKSGRLILLSAKPVWKHKLMLLSLHSFAKDPFVVKMSERLQQISRDSKNMVRV